MEFIDHFIARSVLKANKNPDVLEIGPKHGRHTKICESVKPNSIKMIELPSKEPHIEKWIDELTSPHEIIYQDFLRWDAGEAKFDFMLCCGVLYHNTEQLRFLKKLRWLAKPGALIVVESATTKTPILKDLPCIDIIHDDETHDGEGFLRFFPSQRGLLAMMEMAEWNVVESCVNDLNRFTMLATPSDKKYAPYDVTDVDHTFF